MYVVLGFTPRIDAASIRRSLCARGAVCQAVGARVAPTGGLLSAAGVLGAAVFLALSMDAPLSSVALVVGFTGQSWGAYVPLAVAVGVAWGVKRLWEAHRAWVLAGA